MKREVIGYCPICQSDLQVTKLKCEHCSTEIHGEFYLSKFNYLSKEHLFFIEMFIKNQGNIKAIEKEMGISYPTVKKNLDEVLVALGYSEFKEETTGKEFARSEIIERLRNKEITAEEAEKLLRKAK